MMTNADIFGLLYSRPPVNDATPHGLQSFSLHGTPAKLLLQLCSHPTHLAILVELLTINLQAWARRTGLTQSRTLG